MLFGQGMDFLLRVYQATIVGLVMSGNIYYEWGGEGLAPAGLGVIAAWIMTIIPIKMWDAIGWLTGRHIPAPSHQSEKDLEQRGYLIRWIEEAEQSDLAKPSAPRLPPSSARRGPRAR